MTYRTFALGSTALIAAFIVFLAVPRTRSLRARWGLSPPEPAARSVPRSTSSSAEDSGRPAVPPTPARAASTAGRAPMRPALGFLLDRESGAEIRQWTAAHGLDCARHSGRKAWFWQCTNVPAEAFGQHDAPPATYLVFIVRNSGALFGVGAIWKGLASHDAAQLLGEFRDRLAPKVGRPTRVIGALGAPHGVRIEYRYADYLGALFGKPEAGGHVIVREQFQASSGSRL